VARAWNEESGEKVDTEPLITGRRVNSVKYLDISKAKRFLGWQPSTPLGEGLRETMAWYRAHRDIVGR
jgi:nucleoside-diphosphate-sugar epimerase